MAPPPDQLAAFYKLVDKRAIASALCRHARNAELSASAAVQAEALFGENSLVVASLRMGGSDSLTCWAAEASGAERETLVRQAWETLLSVLPLLLLRAEANTLLPGTVREEELDYTARVLDAVGKAQKEPLSSPGSILRAVASTMGYVTLLLAMYRSLDLLALPLWSAAQMRMVQSFVLQGLDVIPRTAGIRANIACEYRLVAMVERDMNPQNYEPTFYATVLRKWRSNAVRSVLQARGVLQIGVAKDEQTRAEFDARKRADVAKHGLRDSALPSCSNTEKTVKEFAGCSGCRSVVYCCLEHQALDWRAHKKACREMEAARLAEEGVAEESAGGAATG